MNGAILEGFRRGSAPALSRFFLLHTERSQTTALSENHQRIHQALGYKIRERYEADNAPALVA